MYYVPSAMPVPAFVPVPAYQSYHPMMQQFGSMPTQQLVPQGTWVYCATPVYPTSLMQQQRADQTSVRVLKNVKLFKTELCRSWMDFGRCNYGNHCLYAHGEEERRSKRRVRHPKYKTEKCSVFAQFGKCAYGAGCDFVHDESVFNNSPPASLKSETTSAVSSATNSPHCSIRSTAAFRWPSIDALEQFHLQQQHDHTGMSTTSAYHMSAPQPPISGRLPVFQSITDSNDHY